MKKKTLMIFFSIFTESVSNIVPPSKEIAVDKRFQTTTKRPTPTTTCKCSKCIEIDVRIFKRYLSLP